jgi:hypothetical protein
MTETNEEPRTRTERLDALIRRSPPVLVVGLLLFVVTTAGAIYTLGHGLWSWYDHAYRWRNHEYIRLHSLHAGYTERKFEESLGAPAFHNVKGDWTENTFRGRDYWLQTVTRRGSARVVYFSVLSCSKSFNPTFQLPDATKITLNGMALSQVGDSSDFADYFAPGATANAHFYDILQGSNPTNYKSYAWGFDDACLNMKPWTAFLTKPFLKAVGFAGVYQGDPLAGGPAIQGFRKRIPVNMYAETSPFDDFATGAFQVGPDRILIRTITSPISEPPQGNPERRPRTDIDTFGFRLPPREHRVANCFESPLNSPDFPEVDAGHSAVLYGVAPPSVGRYTNGHFLAISGTFGTPGRNQSAVLFFAKSNREAIRVARSLRSHEQGVVRLDGDIILLWHSRPTERAQSTVEGCLFG